MYSISLIIITYNRKKELRRALESALPHMDSTMEVIIWDNHSTDNTKEEICEYLEQWGGHYTYYYSEENLGVAGGRNGAYNLANGKYLFALDDDAVIVTDNIFRQVVDFMEQDSKIAAAGIKIYEPSTDREIISVVKEGTSGENLLLSFCGGGHILRKDYIESVERVYPEKLQFGSEEAYVSHRIWNSGMKIVYAGQFQINHLPVKNAYLGKKRDMDVLLNNYIVRKLTYPKGIMFVEGLVFGLRLMKNRFLNQKDIRMLKVLYKERYLKSESNHMSWSTFRFLIKTFGVSKIV